MSSKWRSLQHRHRYTYTSIVFPKHYLEALTLVPAEISSSNFFVRLSNLISLTSTYSQVVVVKDLASAYVQFLSTTGTPDEAVLAATKLYLEILFLENSLPLHRTLISVLAKCKKFSTVISGCFALLCEEYGGSGSKAKKRFMVSRAALSLIGYPKLGFLDEAVERCAEIMALDVVDGLDGVTKDIGEGSRPSPVVMEQCQEAMSCMYYLLQRYPYKFIGLDKASSVFKSAVRTILSVLKSSAFSRDCLVASGVSFCAAIQVFMSTEEISWFISQGLFGIYANHEDRKNQSVHNVFSDFDLCEQIRDLSVLSRLCLLRGILTSIPRTVLNMHQLHSSGPLWTVLYDGILPELCKHCENPVDSHFNFHALTVTQICLQQIKTSVSSDITDFSGDYKPFSRDVVNRILGIIWRNLEDPLSQTVKQVHLIFDLLLDIELCIASEDREHNNNLFLCNVANDLLRLGPRCKGRYVPLASLTKRLGAKSLLTLKSNLLSETAYAYIDDDVCCAVTTFLKSFLETLRGECWNDDGVELGYDAFRALCLPPFMRGLVSGNSKLRSNLNTYALPALIEVDAESIFTMLGFISIGPSTNETKLDVVLKNDQCIAALVSLLKVSRNLALVEGDIDLDPDELSQIQQMDSKGAAVISVKGIKVTVPFNWFALALTHSDESLRIDAAESLFLNPKTSSLPSSLELSLLKEAVPLNMRCSSTAFQMKWTSLFRKFFARVRTALDRQVKQGSWIPSLTSSVKGAGSIDTSKATVVKRAEDLFQFMKWLSSFLFNSCYPSGPYERKTIAMELILTLLDVWPICRSEGKIDLYPYNDSIILPDSTISFVGSIIDSWDRLRENSFRILLQFPTPLPGISLSTSINDVIRWAKKLVLSPRVRESDAGALTFRLIFRKYVLQLGCILVFSKESDCLECYTQSMNGDTEVTSQNPVAQYISSLIQWLCIVVEEGERDLSEACKKSFVHGVLLTLRYTFDEMDWNSEVVQSCISEMRYLVEKLLQLIMRVTSVALWVVSSDALSLPYDMDDMIDDGSFLSDIYDDQPTTTSEREEKNAKPGSNGKPAEQVVMVGCWLAMKEVSLLFGTIIRKIPLPGCSHSASSQNGLPDSIEETSISEEILDVGQLKMMGDHFLQVLLKMKHNGAIDKTRAGFTALCNRLLCSNDSRLCKMTESWMVLLMDRTIAKGQTVDDLIRRSAGIPAAFIALFLAEPEGTPKKLLPRALEWLIEFAKNSLANFQKDSNQRSGVMKELLESQSETTSVYSNGNLSKGRDEGVVPTVHVFNVLKAAFNDANLATDTSGFSAEATIVAIRAFSSPYWEVRNAACLAYTALVRRMVGFLNVQKRESARRSLTGLEFFHRYPALHPFLSSELQTTTEQLADGVSSNLESHITKAIHPSLCPILILLSRLKPSPISCGTDDSLDPFLLLPFIQRCATQSNYRVRILASRALTCLVSNERLQYVISDILDNLPRGSHKAMAHSVQHTDPAISANMGKANVLLLSKSFNSIHGLLLQLASLLDNNFRGLTDGSMKDQIIGLLLEVLSRCSWLGCTKLCSCPIVITSYLRVLDLMLDVARTGKSRHTEVIQALLLELTSQCLSNTASTQYAFHDPTRIELKQQATESFLSCVGLSKKTDETNDDDVQLQILGEPTLEMPRVDYSLHEVHKEILSCLTDPSYDVRITVLKRILWLTKSIRHGYADNILHQWAGVNLQPALMERLFVEEHPKCLYYNLKIIFSWNMEFPFNNGEDSSTLLSLWDRLVHLNSTMSHAKTREIVLCCMGMCMKLFTKQSRGGISMDCLKTSEISASFVRINEGDGLSDAMLRLNLFVTLVKNQSEPSESMNARRAAAEAIVASGLLEEASYVASSVSNMYSPSEFDEDHTKEKCMEDSVFEFVSLYTCKILDLWFVCIQLLEDEDAYLRQKLAKDIQKIIAKGSANTFCDDSTPLQVDRVIELSLDYLTSLFGLWLKYVEFLLRIVLGTGNALNSRGDLVRQIFDKEIDNHHEEKLLICQICCSNIQKLLNSKCQMEAGAETKLFLQNWREIFLKQLTSLTGGYIEKEGKNDWIGGIGNHKDVFISVYAVLLGLYALTQSGSLDQLEDHCAVYLQEFANLERSITPFLKNPLISNLYALVKLSHERFISSDKPEDQVGDSGSSFDPYFLIR
ncbi:thyroid adenoma-associated protein homolog [Zea mays]|uniref:Thyroid adenoma-associated protein-like protein n=3 Tax=Zea mays TaxID=4577 RepID=A0A1D6IZF1_MAIZE|nr:thyroid adenoma-associated protein homolog [Zea mays]AQK41237.1 Thyroid adenoma-associated protein-like protein [Zea mays]AQK41245.1 Thyroid adenoma-associated protein-like protein [Zea mays]|eukprot:XP_008662801.1 thyroid adenoma-associated protein homolog [Zea mays]